MLSGNVQTLQLHKRKKGSIPVVIDAVDLQTHAEKIMKGYCDVMEILRYRCCLGNQATLFLGTKVGTSNCIQLSSMQYSGFIKTNLMVKNYSN